MDAVLAGVVGVPAERLRRRSSAERLGEIDADRASERCAMISAGVRSMFGPEEWSSNSNSSRWS